MKQCIFILIFVIVLVLYLMPHVWPQDKPLMESQTYIIKEDASRMTMTLCISDEMMREKIRQIMLDGLDTALQEQVQHVFEVWIKDAQGQPARAAVGIRRAVSAYLQARTAALTWMPPECGQPAPKQ